MAEASPIPQKIRRTYSEDEIRNLYSLAKLSLENGQIHRAEKILLGLNEVAPDFLPGWLALSYLHHLHRNWDLALQVARQTYKLNPQSVEATLFLVVFLLQSGDFTTAGSYLGEVRERIETGAVDEPNVVRFYKAQLARFQGR